MPRGGLRPTYSAAMFAFPEAPSQLRFVRFQSPIWTIDRFNVLEHVAFQDHSRSSKTPVKLSLLSQKKKHNENHTSLASENGGCGLPSGAVRDVRRLSEKKKKKKKNKKKKGRKTKCFLQIST